MKTIVKLLLAAAILHAVVRAGMSAVTYYQFKDASQQLLVFGAGSSESELLDLIVLEASELEIPLTAETVTVRRDSVRTVAEASYVDRVELLPRYRYPVKYSFRVEALSLQGAGGSRGHSRR